MELMYNVDEELVDICSACYAQCCVNSHTGSNSDYA